MLTSRRPHRMRTDTLRPWHRLMPTLALIAALLLLFRDTAAAMVAIWWRSETFTHAFLVPPIVAWLIWRQRHVLASVPDKPVPALLLLLAGACFLWLLGELATVGAASQFALVSLIVLSVVALHGWAVARAITFPLVFLFFAVPLGEFLVPSLMEGTADFTVLALRASGLPVYREGLQFVIPSGTWSVVEACSGVRYLIASLMVGTLFAYLNYQSFQKRLVFIVAALLVPVVANWLRAYMIVMIGHLSSNELAAGVDHLIYGWIFFGVVIGLMFLVGARWADPEPAAPAAPAAALASPSGSRVWFMATAVLALLLGVRGLQTVLLGVGDAPVPPIALAPAGAGGEWVRVDDSGPPWTPGYPQANTTAQGAYAQDGERVVVWLGYFRQQGTERKLVSSVNGLVAFGDRSWSPTARSVRAEEQDLPPFRTAELRQGHTLDGARSSRMRVWQVYWIGGRWVISDVRAKLYQAFDQLLGRGDDGAVLMIATPAGDDADATLEKFSRAHMAGIAAALTRARDTR